MSIRTPVAPTTRLGCGSQRRTTETAPQTPGRTTDGQMIGRDAVIDLVRAGALAVVVIWHWAFTTLSWGSDGPRVGNPVGETPGMWALTWFLQVMPLFFLVGGALHSMDRRRDLDFVNNRFRRLVPPVLPLLGLAVLATAGALALGHPDVARGVVLMITPLWFLAVYLVLVLLTPLARRVHERYGLWAIAAGTLAVAAVDRIVIGSGNVLGVELERGGAIWLAVLLGQYVLTWAVVHQLGFHLGALRRAPRTAQWATCLGGFGLLAFGAFMWGYPWSMVGTHPDPISNMSPPNLMVAFLAVGQMGLLVLVDRPLRRFAERRSAALGTAGAWSMTVYVWHMLALAGFWGLVVMQTGPVDHTVDAAWWLWRPVWVVGPLLIAVPLFLLTGPGGQDWRRRLRERARLHRDLRRIST